MSIIRVFATHELNSQATGRQVALELPFQVVLLSEHLEAIKALESCVEYIEQGCEGYEPTCLIKAREFTHSLLAAPTPDKPQQESEER